jgi:hypothetical protein
MFGKPVINIPDLFYCGSCKSVYLYRRNIINHFCKAHLGGKKEASREGNITELFEDWNSEEHLASGKRKITELRESCNLEKFLTWFLLQVLVDDDPKYFSNDLFHDICQKYLLGAPENLHFGEFMIWISSEKCRMDLCSFNSFLCTLFVYPRHVVESDWYMQCIPFIKRDDARITPTICIYDVEKNVEDKKNYDSNADNVEDAGEDDDGALYDSDYEYDGEYWIDHLDSNVPFPEDGVSSKMVNELVLISAEDAEKILSSTCKFSVKDAGMFLSKFPESEACRLNPKRMLEYHRVKNIWNLFGPKPVTECWDLGFSKSIVRRCGVTDLYYPEHEMLCHAVGRPLVPYPVFELYSIVINKLCSKRDFSLIYMSNRATCKHALTIYRVSKGETAELHESLSLKGPFRLPTPFCDVSISFTDSNTAKDEWRFSHDASRLEKCLREVRVFQAESDDVIPKGRTYDVVIAKRCKGVYHNSVATIKYRISLSALRAELVFTLYDGGSGKIFITRGEISATDADDCRTKRIIRRYNKRMHVLSGRSFRVNRSAFGVPIGSYLRVNVDLDYTVDRTDKKIEGYLDFKVPTHVLTQGLTLPASDDSTSFLCVETFWTGEERS